MKNQKNIEIDLAYIEKNLILYIDAKKETDIEVDENNQYTHEPQYQLKEGHFYDYEFSNKDYRLTCNDQENIVQKRARNEHIGRIAPNIFVGTLALEIFNINTPNKKGELKLEVQSTKTSYRSDYQYMLNSITEKCTDLILQANSPVSHSFETDFNADNKTLYQRFAFVKSMVNSEEFEDAIHRIISSPTTEWTEKAEDTDVRKIKRFRNNEIKQLLNSNNRTKLSPNHILYSLKIKSVATKISSYKKIESVDTSENRFIKHVLNKSVSKLELIKLGARNKDTDKPRISNSYHDRLGGWQKPLRSYLNQPFFKEVGKFEGLNKESLVLQQKPGYAKVYRIWQELKWHLEFLGGDGFLSQKNVAEMYEIWCFLQIRLLITQMGFEETKTANKQYKIDRNALESKDPLVGGFEFIRKSDGVKITLAHEPLFNETKRPIRVWTVSQRPDIVMEVRIPDGGSFVWVFDAKYRIESKENMRDSSNNSDLAPDDAINQMHRYRDALIHSTDDQLYSSVKKSRPVYGAYVLYPGFYDQLDLTIKNPYQEAIDEIGIGAFSLLPSENGSGSEWLKEFLQNKLSGAVQKNGETSSDRYFVEESARIPYRGTAVTRYKDLTILFSGAVGGRTQEYTKKLNTNKLPFYHTQLIATERQQIEGHIINEVKFLGVANSGNSDTQSITGLYPVLSVKRVQRKDISIEISGSIYDSNSTKFYWLFELGTAAVLQKSIQLKTPDHFTVSLVGYENALGGGRLEGIPPLYFSVLN